jgi:hypothetical protein
VHPRGRQAQRPRRRRQGQLPPHLLRDARSRRMGAELRAWPLPHLCPPPPPPPSPEG